MRIRSIKPEFWNSDDIAALPWDDRLLFIGLWSYVDDNGVGRDSEKLITAQLFPLEDDPRETLAKVRRGLASLAARGLIVRYTIGSKPLLYVATWSKHQKIDRPTRSHFPLPAVDLEQLDESSRETIEGSSDGSRDLGTKGPREQGSEGDASEPDPAPPEKGPKGTRIPKDFIPSEATRQTIVGEFPHLDIAAEHRKFTDHWLAQPSQKGVKVDWDATWRNWMRRAGEWVNVNTQRKTQPSRNKKIIDDYLAERAALNNQQLAIGQPILEGELLP